MDDKQLVEATRERLSQANALREQVARQAILDMSFYEGLQWAQSTSDGIRTLANNSDMDASKFRTTYNETTRIVQNIIASTAPERIGVDVTQLGLPTHASLLTARAMEAAVSAVVDETRMHSRRVTANERRCIAGSYVVGFDLDLVVRQNDTEESEDSSLHCFHAAPWQLVLDPAQDEPCLADHQFVYVETAMTLDEVKRRFGVTVDPEKCRTLGELATGQVALAQSSGGRLFARYRHQSRTKAVNVYRYYARDGGRRFETFRILIDDPAKREMVVLRHPDRENPFGAHGLPVERYLAHPRSDTAERISDTRNLRDAQQNLNVLYTAVMRQVLRSAGWQWMADEKALPRGLTQENIDKMFSNQVGGVIMYNGGTMRDQKQPPRLVSYPSPDPQLVDMIARGRDVLRERGHRSQTHVGEIKSHVPLGAVNRSLQEAGLPHGQRIRTDVESDTRLLRVLGGTIVDLLKRNHPSMRRLLEDHRLTRDEIAALQLVNPYRLPVGIQGREGAVRQEPYEVKQEKIAQAVQAGVLSGPKARLAMAKDLDAPLTEQDGLMLRSSRLAVQRIMAGQLYLPPRTGEYTDFFLDALLGAMNSEDAVRNPELAKRLQDAYDAVLENAGQEMLMRDPNYVAQRQQAMQQAQPAPGGEMEAGMEDDLSEPPDVTLDQVLPMLLEAAPQPGEGPLEDELVGQAG